ncbi:Zinc finger, RING-type [Cinnamomum micranthum f. kanehirae]|uniref:RING-type E3 ubiquitin transferase n=1 Tax=Cinnamomum micranthum f. kanehirae TaxID=337451 RepID=A0A3S3PGV5_9MAGN|nr:Zinc finger, RING-type [Cinnamomum micranthum f. kanehirae]
MPRMGLMLWIDQKIVEPLVQILQRGAEPKQLAFSAALGITLGIFPICGVTVILCGMAIALLGTLCHAPSVMLANFIATPIELSLVVPFLRFGEVISGGPHFPLTSDALKKVVTGQASREVLFSIFHALLGWLVAAPFILGFLFMVFLPCFKLLIQKFSALPSSPNKPFYPNAEVKLKAVVMSHSSSDPPYCCSSASPELKLYQAFIFSVPIFFTFILLLLFYLFYLRRRRVDWSSLRMRTPYLDRGVTSSSAASEPGLKKEMREMLPVVIFRESFLIRDTQCSICLGDYKANDRLQQIPMCGHTFHMDCINHWLTNNTTCPLCRVSLLPASKAASDPVDTQEAYANETEQLHIESTEQDGDEVLLRDQEGGRGEERESCSGSEEQEFCDARREVEQCGSNGEQEFCDTRREVEQCGSNGEGSVVIDIEDHRILRNQ